MKLIPRQRSDDSNCADPIELSYPLQVMKLPPRQRSDDSDYTKPIKLSYPLQVMKLPPRQRSDDSDYTKPIKLSYFYSSDPTARIQGGLTSPHIGTDLDGQKISDFSKVQTNHTVNLQWYTTILVCQAFTEVWSLCA